MAIPLLKTRLYIPPPRPGLVSRPHLIERLDEGLRQGCKLTLISAPAGFGKTTLLAEWVASCTRDTRIAWVWYRYHHLFADLLRSRLQAISELISPAEGESVEVAELHQRQCVVRGGGMDRRSDGSRIGGGRP